MLIQAKVAHVPLRPLMGQVEWPGDGPQRSQIVLHKAMRYTSGFKVQR